MPPSDLPGKPTGKQPSRKAPPPGAASSVTDVPGDSDEEQERIYASYELARLESFAVSRLKDHGLKADPISKVWTYPGTQHRDGTVTKYRFDRDELLVMARDVLNNQSKNPKELVHAAGIASVLHDDLWKEYERGPTWKLVAQLALIAASVPDPLAIEQVLANNYSQHGTSGGEQSGISRRKRKREDIDRAARAYNELHAKDEFRRPKLKDLAARTRIPLGRLKYFTITVIKSRAREIKDISRN